MAGEIVWHAMLGEKMGLRIYTAPEIIRHTILWKKVRIWSKMLVVHTGQVNIKLAHITTVQPNIATVHSTNIARKDLSRIGRRECEPKLVVMILVIEIQG